MCRQPFLSCSRMGGAQHLSVGESSPQLQTNRRQCPGEMCRKRWKRGKRNLPFSSHFLFLILLFHFSHFFPLLFFPPPTSSPCLVSFHLLFPDLPAIIWLSLPLWHFEFYYSHLWCLLTCFSACCAFPPSISCHGPVIICNSANERESRGAASLSEPCRWYWWQFSWSDKSLRAHSQPDSSFAC